MEKLMYILWKDRSEKRSDFCGRLQEKTAAALLELEEVRHLQFNLVDEDIRAGEEMMLQNNCLPRPFAFIFTWLDSAFYRSPVDKLIREDCTRYAAYVVTESMPIVNDSSTAPPGRRTPGFAQCTVLQKPPRLAREDWLNIWLNSHTRIAIDTQSTFLYVQNIITRSLTYGAPHFDAVVEEGFPAAALTSWSAFYDAVGDEEKLQKNQKIMLDSCQRFIDFDRLDVNLTSQYILR